MTGALNDPKEMGTALLKQGKFDEAAAVLREAVTLDSEDEGAWRLLGGALASKGDASGAITAFQNAVRILPMSARSHYNLGLAYQSAGRLVEAKLSLEKALGLDPGYEQARVRLGEVAQQLGGGRSGAAPTSAEGHTNVSGGGNTTGLGSIGSVYQQAQAQTQTATHSNITGGNSTGLLTIGAHREAANATPTAGHSNITGGSTVGLGTIGAAATPSAESGHTNITGGSTAMLGTVGAAGGPPTTPTLRGATPPPSPVPPPVSAGPSLTPPPSAPSGYVPPPVLGQNYTRDLTNTSGMKSDVPEEAARGFNWGAFFFSWLWLLNMRMVPLGLALLIGPAVVGGITGGIAATTDGPIPLILRGSVNIAQFAIAIYLGLQGNRLAWQNRTWVSIEDFHRCQRIWAYWALGVFLASVVLAIIFVVIMGAAISTIGAGARPGAYPTP